MFISCQQNAGQSRHIKACNESLENVEKFIIWERQ